MTNIPNTTGEIRPNPTQTEAAEEIYDALADRLEQFGAVLRLLLNSPDGMSHAALRGLESLLKPADAEYVWLCKVLNQEGEAALLPCGLALEQCGDVLSALTVASLPPGKVFSALCGVNTLLGVAKDAQAKGWDTLKAMEAKPAGGCSRE
jgi:hypothetical protein